MTDKKINIHNLEVNSIGMNSYFMCFVENYYHRYNLTLLKINVCISIYDTSVIITVTTTTLCKVFVIILRYN